MASWFSCCACDHQLAGKPSVAEVAIAEGPVLQLPEKKQPGAEVLVVNRPVEVKLESEPLSEEFVPSSGSQAPSRPVAKDAVEVEQLAMLNRAGFSETRMMEFYDKLSPNHREIYGPRRPSAVGKDLPRYVASHWSAFAKLRAMEPMEGWYFKAEQDGCQIYTKHEHDQAIMSFKAITTLDTKGGGIIPIANGLIDVENRPKWDPMIMECRTLEKHIPYYVCVYVAVKAPAPVVSNRDMVFAARVMVEDDGSSFIAMETIEHPEVPELPGFVRARMQGGYIIRPTSTPSVFRVIWTGQVDARGWIPTWASNLVAWRQGLTLALFRQAYLQDQLK